MTDFSRPEYASYVALMGELKLERVFREGDWWRDLDQATDLPQLFHFEYLTEYGPWFKRAGSHPWNNGMGNYDVIWLPTLSDWLEMLEGVGYSTVEFKPLSADVGGWLAHVPLLEDAYGAGQVREEAAARLWLAVRKPVEATERQ